MALTTPIWGTVGHVKVNSFYSQPVHKIQSLALTTLKIFFGGVKF